MSGVRFRVVPARGRSARDGLTLYEVVLALAIFAIALTAIGHLLDTGSRAATESRMRTQAMLLCRSKLAEVISGVEPMQSVAEVAVDDGSSGWVWSLNVASGPVPDLLELQVTAAHRGPGNIIDASFTIHRFARDPAAYAAAEEAAAAAAEESSTGTTP